MQIKVKAVPNSRENSVEEISENIYKIKTTEKPEKGKANSAILKLLSKYLNIPKSKIILTKGEKSQNKAFDIILKKL